MVSESKKKYNDACESTLECDSSLNIVCSSQKTCKCNQNSFFNGAACGKFSRGFQKSSRKLIKWCLIKREKEETEKPAQTRWCATPMLDLSVLKTSAHVTPRLSLMATSASERVVSRMYAIGKILATRRQHLFVRREFVFANQRTTTTPNPSHVVTSCPL